MSEMSGKRERAERTKITPGQIVLGVVILIITLFCFAPVLLVFIVSLSSQHSVETLGFTFFPSSWSLDAYKHVFSYGEQFVISYQVTIFETLAGTVVTLLITSMFAYSLSRKEFQLRGALSIYLLITMLFSGGLLGTFLIYSNVYHLRNNLLVLILPGAVSATNCIVMRTFINSNVPDSLVEAARIDGASEPYTFFRIVLPIMTPVLASIGFMAAVSHWNEWQTCMLYIDDPNLATLQLMLMRVEKDINFLTMREAQGNMSAMEMARLQSMPKTPTRMALLFCTLGPVLFIYPFFQRYFLRGMTIGSVKG